MKRTIRPAEEEISGVIPTLVFAAAWYAIVFRSIVSAGFGPYMLIFLVGGLLMPYTAVNNLRRALFYRRQRAEAVALENVAQGRITGVERQYVPYRKGRHRRYRRYYFLQVEMYDPATGAANTIQSQGYRKPIHRYLASDRVSVYTDGSGWKHYIEDFQWKEHRGDPDIFNMPKEFMGGEILGKVIFVFIAAWLLIQALLR